MVGVRRPSRARMPPPGLARSMSSWRGPPLRGRASPATCGRAEPIDERTVAEPAVAHHERCPSERVHDRPDDAGAGQDDLTTTRLETHGVTALVRALAAIALDLALQLIRLEACPTHHVRVIRIERQLDGH